LGGLVLLDPRRERALLGLIAIAVDVIAPRRRLAGRAAALLRGAVLLALAFAIHSGACLLLAATRSRGRGRS
jgi:hypothetical protein